MKPRINLVYLCHSTSPDPATHPLMNTLAATQIGAAADTNSCTHNKMPNLMHAYTPQHLVVGACKHKSMLSTCKGNTLLNTTFKSVREGQY